MPSLGSMLPPKLIYAYFLPLLNRSPALITELQAEADRKKSTHLRSNDYIQ